MRYTRADIPDEAARVDHVSVEPRVGYQWFPFGRGFYVEPWIGAAIFVTSRGSSEIGDDRYEQIPIVPLYGANLGAQW